MLNLHSGGELITYDDLRQIEPPAPTATHHPMAHHAVVDMVKYALGFYNHEVLEEHHAIDKDGDRYFGLLTLASKYGNYTDTVGLRNSSDKSFPIGIAFGARVFVCSNLSFSGDQVIKRRHTINAKRDLPGLVAQVIEPLAEQRERQYQQLVRFQETPLSDELADQTIMQLYRQGVINVQRIAHVVNQWDEPECDWGDKTAWRLFNAVTFALNGKVMENPGATTQLHQVIEGVCETIH